MPMRSLRYALVALTFVCSLAVALAQAAAAAPPADALRVLEATQDVFRSVHDKVAPAIVSITTRMTVQDNGGSDFFGFRSAPQPRTATAWGSGVIIRNDGIVVTNSHVVQNATKVSVQLSGSDKALPAEVLQTDSRTDLAVLRITDKGTYPAVTLGNADNVRVGDWAIAFGSPFRLSTTMTVGVISATGRQLPSPTDDTNYRDLLQTDAAINPGNSGGALVNIRGEVVGINFMIFSPGDNPGSVGIGFAIPINDYTKDIINTLAGGKPFERGLLGVRMSDLNATMREQYGVADGGVFIAEVAPGGAAEKAGIKAEDILVQYGDTKITSADQFARLVERTHPGSKVQITLVRNKKTEKVTATIGGVSSGATTAQAGKIGLTVTAVTSELANQFNLPGGAKGVMVTAVEDGSPAEDAGLRMRDVIVRVGTQANGEAVNTPDEFWTAIDKRFSAGAKGVILLGYRGNRQVYWTIERPK
jgi:serine protease Do